MKSIRDLGERFWNIRFICFLWLMLAGISSCRESTGHSAAGGHADTCDNPDAPIPCCFVKAPSKLTSSMIIPADEPTAPPLHITGTIYRADGKTPYPGVLMYAYHTDATGHYSKKGNETGFQKWHGYLQGWCVTDAAGHYEIHTIRPAPYPTNTMPAHIHAAIKDPDGRMFYISDFVFRDDTLVNERYLSGNTGLTGGNGIVETVHENGAWMGKRDIILN